MRATLTNYRQSPRKVRLVANLIKGKSVDQANTELSFLAKRASLPFQKLLQSAVANAKQNSGIDAANLFVVDARVDKGVVMKRSMPRAMGSASRINKRSSHVTIVLGERGAVVAPKAKKVSLKVEKTEKVAEKKVVKAKTAVKKVTKKEKAK